MPKFRTENVCFVTITNLGVLIPMIVISFVLSDIILTVLYRRLVAYVRHASLRVQGNQQQQMRRDLALTRRITLLNGQLVVVGIPAFMFLILCRIRPDLLLDKWLRFLLLAANTALCPTLLILFWITPNLRQSLTEGWNRAKQGISTSSNRVLPVRIETRF